MLNPELEPRIKVNLETREIIVPELLKNIGVTEDDNAETVYIEVTDKYDNIPLDDKTVFIWFKNANEELYCTEITELNIQHEDGMLIIAWKIDERLTRYSGTVSFSMQFAANRYRLNTLSAELNVLRGLEKYDYAPTLENNLYEQIIFSISNIERRLGELSENAEKISDLQDKINEHESLIIESRNEIKYLKEHVVFIPT